MRAASPTPLAFAPRSGRSGVLDDSADPASVDAGVVGGKALRLLRLRSLDAPVPPFVVVTTAAFRDALGSDPVVRDLLARLRDEMGRSDPASLARLEALSEKATARVLPSGAPTLSPGRCGRLSTPVDSSRVASPCGPRRSARTRRVTPSPACSTPSSTSKPSGSPGRWPGSGRRPSRRGLSPTGRAWGSASTLSPRRSSSRRWWTRRCPGSFSPATPTIPARSWSRRHRGWARVSSRARRSARPTASRARTVGGRANLVSGAPAALVEAESRHLVSQGLEIERALEGPQDVEWALDSRRRLHVLQARPVTVARVLPSRGERRLFENANVVESYPGLTRPLTFSFALEGYERALRRAARGLVPLASPLERRPHLFGSLIALVEGRVYYNLTDWYEIFSCLARPDAHRRSWDRHLGMAHDESLPVPPPAPLAARLQALVGVCLVLLGVQRVGRRFAARFAETTAAVPRPRAGRRHARRTVPHLPLARRVRRCLLAPHPLQRPVRHALPGRARGPRPALVPGRTRRMAASLLATGGGMESLAPVESLRALADAIEREPRALGSPEERTPGPRGPPSSAAPPRPPCGRPSSGTSRPSATAASRSSSSRLRRSARSPGAFSRCSSGPARSGARRCASPERTRAAERPSGSSSALALPKGLALRFVLRRARQALLQRESMRLARARLFGLARALFRRLGDELWTHGVLRRPEDVFDLTTTEVLGFFEGTTVTRDLQALVDLRRREYEAFATRSPAGRLETIGPPALGVHRPSGGPERRSPQEVAGERVLRGTPCVGGIARGPLRVVVDPADEPPGKARRRWRGPPTPAGCSS